jgi:hypothetical protein
MRCLLIPLLVVFMELAVADGEVPMQPFVMDRRDNAAPLVDLSSFLEASVGRNEHIGSRPRVS